MKSYPELKMYIDGEWVGLAGREFHQVLNPATELPLGRLPLANQIDLERALDAADRAFASWRKTSAYVRSTIMRKAADLVRERKNQIAIVLSQEQGKPFVEAQAEVAGTADIIDWMAEEGRRAYGRIIPARDADVRQMVVSEPVGIVAAFSPWNFPTYTPVRKIAGALAAGCSIILKPAEETPGSAIELARCFHDAGLPRGVLNLVFGVPDLVSRLLIEAPAIKKISFTGSVPVGKRLAELAARGMKRATMELGGHSPVIVLEDADTERAADIIAPFKFRNAGQVCVAPNRFFVHESVIDRFVARFKEHAERITLGDGLASTTTMGPLANERRLHAMERFVADARSHSANIQYGGHRYGNRGYFFMPTVITELPDNSAIMTEEPFGPLAPIVPFKSLDEAIFRANSLPLGLAAYAFTSSITKAQTVCAELQAGMVGINSTAISTPETPFGGIKESGYGQEGGIEGLEAYMVKKFISQR